MILNDLDRVATAVTNAYDAINNDPQLYAAARSTGYLDELTAIHARLRNLAGAALDTLHTEKAKGARHA